MRIWIRFVIFNILKTMDVHPGISNLLSIDYADAIGMKIDEVGGTIVWKILPIIQRQMEEGLAFPAEVGSIGLDSCIGYINPSP